MQNYRWVKRTNRISFDYDRTTLEQSRKNSIRTITHSERFVGQKW